jgi:hypothetical protein
LRLAGEPGAYQRWTNPCALQAELRHFVVPTRSAGRWRGFPNRAPQTNPLSTITSAQPSTGSKPVTFLKSPVTFAEIRTNGSWAESGTCYDLCPTRGRSAVHGQLHRPYAWHRCAIVPKGRSHGSIPQRPSWSGARMSCEGNSASRPRTSRPAQRCLHRSSE